MQRGVTALRANSLKLVGEQANTFAIVQAIVEKKPCPFGWVGPFWNFFATQGAVIRESL